MRSIHDRVSTRARRAAGGLVIGLIVGVPALAGQVTQPDDAYTSCHEEVRRVAVSAKAGNPKFARNIRYEDRKVTLCDGKIVTAEDRSRSARVLRAQ